MWEGDWESVMGVSPACLFTSTRSLRQVSHGIDPSPQRLWVIAVPPILTGERVWGPAAFPSRDPCGAQVGAPSGGAELCCGGCSACISHPQMLILRAHPATSCTSPHLRDGLQDHPVCSRAWRWSHVLGRSCRLKRCTWWGMRGPCQVGANQGMSPSRQCSRGDSG